ncbi:MAG: LysM peptidoglycan-binding domain-containing protein [Phototrophicales bacterium]|nr:LysM peptidoglycan-binding domain-containing protein [Phototrophicales bacterium]
MKFWAVCVFIAIGIMGCSPQPATEITIDSLQCSRINATAPNITCIDLPDNAVLMQIKSREPVTIRTSETNPINLTFNATVYWQRNGALMTVAVIDGDSVIGTPIGTRNLRTGQQITLSISQENTVLAIPDAPADATLSVIQGMQQLTEAPTARPTNTPRPNFTPDPESTALVDGCIVNEDWQFTYTVRGGDTLTRIATQYGLTMAQLQTGNCIQDPNRIFSGQELSVPTDANSLITPTVSVILNADSKTLYAGQCTRLFWSVETARLVYLDDVPVAHNAEQQVCPTETREYGLVVTFNNGTQTRYTTSITVLAITPTP